MKHFGTVSKLFTLSSQAFKHFSCESKHRKMLKIQQLNLDWVELNHSFFVLYFHLFWIFRAYLCKRWLFWVFSLSLYIFYFHGHKINLLWCFKRSYKWVIWEHQQFHTSWQLISLHRFFWSRSRKWQSSQKIMFESF